MWRRLLMLSFPILAILSGFQMFFLKYQVIEKEDELKKIHRQILSDNREIHMLEADWALANDPHRLRAFVKTQSHLKPIRSIQFVTIEDLPVKVAPVPASKPESEIFDGEEQPI